MPGSITSLKRVALVQTVDFITPIVDDPFLFGQIAAANSLSDVYAMGGKPLTAMNLVGFPRASLDISVLTEILRGGLEKIHEAGAVLVGGHTMEDPELKYGLSVTGTVHPAEDPHQPRGPGGGRSDFDETPGNGHHFHRPQGGDGRTRSFTGGG